MSNTVPMRLCGPTLAVKPDETVHLIAPDGSVMGTVTVQTIQRGKARLSFRVLPHIEVWREVISAGVMPDDLLKGQA